MYVKKFREEQQCEKVGDGESREESNKSGKEKMNKGKKVKWRRRTRAIILQRETIKIESMWKSGICVMQENFMSVEITRKQDYEKQSRF